MINEQNHIKLVDFGTACFFEPTEGMTEITGTIMYIAPEVLGNKKAYN
jgi:serine/threonine protein kinase